MSKENWRRLDNSAKIFPIISSKKYSSVFRLSAVLKEKVEPEILKQAVNEVLKYYASFKVKLKKGMFWYYYEENNKELIIEEENNYPCKYIDPNTNNDYLFKITYFNNKINLDIFHSLTDGNSGVYLLREIVYTYIEKKYPEVFDEKIREARKIKYDTEDDYIKNYNKKLHSNSSSRKAYILKGKKLPLATIGVIHENINLKELKIVAKEKEVTVTQYLTATLIYAIYTANYIKHKGSRPIKICIPVDLKKYFRSETINNFFSYITVETNMKQVNEFEDILRFVKGDFEKRLSKNEILKLCLQM